MLVVSRSQSNIDVFLTTCSIQCILMIQYIDALMVRCIFGNNNASIYFDNEK